MLIYLAGVFMCSVWFVFRLIYFYFCQTLFLASILNNIASTEYWFFRCFIFFSTIDGSFLLLGACFCVLCLFAFVLFFNFSSVYFSYILCSSGLCFCFCFFSSSSFYFFDAFLHDGYSLNVILRNPIILVHPPFLYFSVASISFLFFLLLFTITWRTFRNFFTWCCLIYCFLAILLFLSICLGGFWAYFVLGWGGWWFWDPVELYAALFCGILFLRIHLFIFNRRQILSHVWFVQELFFLGVLFFYLLVGLFYLRAGLIASIHNFVLDFSSSWLFFFLGNCFFIFLWFYVLAFYKGFYPIIKFEFFTFFNFFCQYLLFNYVVLNGFLSFFFNYFLFQDVFFVTIGYIFSGVSFFFLMWTFSRRSLSFSSLLVYVFVCWFFYYFIPELATPLFFLLILCLLCFVSLFIFFFSTFTYLQSLHNFVVLLALLVVLNKFFSCMFILPMYLGNSFILFNHWFFIPVSLLSYTDTYAGSFFFITQVWFLDNIDIVAQLYISFFYSFFSGLLFYDNAVFSYPTYDIQLFFISALNFLDQQFVGDFYLCKLSVSMVQGVLWYVCLLLVIFGVSWLFFLAKRIFCYK